MSYLRPDGDWVSHGFHTGKFTVFPEQNALEAWEWPDGVTIAATVEGKPECTAHGTAVADPASPQSTFVWMNFPDGCHVAPSDILSLDDGTTRLTHTVQRLAVTKVDAAADSVAGTADAGAPVRAWVHQYHDETGMQLVAKDGKWHADFDSLGFDIMAGMCGRSEIADELGLRTAVDWCAPRP